MWMILCPKLSKSLQDTKTEVHFCRPKCFGPKFRLWNEISNRNSDRNTEIILAHLFRSKFRSRPNFGPKFRYRATHLLCGFRLPLIAGSSKAVGEFWETVAKSKSKSKSKAVGFPAMCLGNPATKRLAGVPGSLGLLQPSHKPPRLWRPQWLRPWGKGKGERVTGPASPAVKEWMERGVLSHHPTFVLTPLHTKRKAEDSHPAHEHDRMRVKHARENPF